MRILFVHQNFPGQFLHLAPALAARGHRVAALTAETNARPSPVPVARYRGEGATAAAGVAGPGATYLAMAERGAVVAGAAAALKARGEPAPDVVFGHSGWGETLFLREVWPEARHLCYAEFLYRSRGLDTGFDPEFGSDTLAARIGVTARRAHLLQALVEADAALAPTEWQAATFPADLRAKITVIHDGIDTARLRPDPAAILALPDGRLLRPGDEVLSFVARSLEPYRGFHIFLRALPAVLAARPGAQVVIVGEAGQSYGPGPRDGGTWTERLRAELAGRIDPARVHFLGRVPHATFRALLQVTRVHAYLTYPFVLSWSLIEALSAGALVVASKTPPVEEVIVDGVNGRLVDFFDVGAWSDALTAALADPAAALPVRARAREGAVARYDLATQSLPRLIRFVEAAP